MGIKLSKNLTVENILDLVSEYDIFKTYCTPFKTLDKFFRSELREDNNPTCKIFMNQNKNLIYHDFNGGSHNCFTYIKEKFGIDFNTVLNVVNRDFKLGLRPTWTSTIEIEEIRPKKYQGKVRSGKKVTILQKKRRKWNSSDKDYWKNKYDIRSKTLQFFKVEAISHYWINYARFTCKTITYSYEFGNGARDIYAPLEKDYKWPASTTKSHLHIYGWAQLPKSGETVFIVSSLKEVMFLYENNINAIAPQSETVFIPEHKLLELKERFKTIIIMYDFDKAGCVNAVKNSIKYDLLYMKFCPVMVNYYQAKDLTDAYEFDKSKILDLINNYQKYL